MFYFLQLINETYLDLTFKQVLDKTYTCQQLPRFRHTLIIVYGAYQRFEIGVVKGGSRIVSTRLRDFPVIALE